MTMKPPATASRQRRDQRQQPSQSRRPAGKEHRLPLYRLIVTQFKIIGRAAIVPLVKRALVPERGDGGVDLGELVVIKKRDQRLVGEPELGSEADRLKDDSFDGARAAIKPLRLVAQADQQLDTEGVVGHRFSSRCLGSGGKASVWFWNNSINPKMI